MRHHILWLLAAVTLWSAASDPVLAQQDDVVEVHATPDLTFEPKIIEIEPGTTVRWIADDGVFHTVTSSDANTRGARQPNGKFDATISGSDPTFEFTFDDEGIYPYYCEPHSDDDMIGSVIVKDGATGRTDKDPESRSASAPALLTLMVVLLGILIIARRR